MASWSFGPFEFSAATYRLRRDGLVIPLEPKALDVLRLLLERAPGVVEKSEIFAVVWKDVAVTDNALTRVVAQLRRALDDDAKNPRYIETVATRGYRMVAEVATNAQTPLPASPAPAAPRFAPQALAAAALLAVIVSGVVWWRSTSGRADAMNRPADDVNMAQLALLRPVQLTTGTSYDGNLAFSHDGTSVAYASDRTGPFEIYVQGLAPGSVPSALTSGGQHVQPTWSPDGRFIAYHDAAGGGVWIVPSRGGTARRVSDIGSRPAWSPDGRLIAFQTLTATGLAIDGPPTAFSSIRVVNVETGAGRALTHIGTPPGPHVSPQWSADGRRIYFAEAPMPYERGAEANRTKIWSADAEGGGLREEGGSDRIHPEFVVAPDRKGAWAVARLAGLWWLPFGSSADRSEAQPTGIPMTGVPSQPALSKDGRWLGWTSVNATTSLWTTNLPGPDGRPASPVPITLGSGVRAPGAAAAADGRLAYSATVRGNTPQVWLREPQGTARQLTLDEGEHLTPFWVAGFSEVAFISSHQGTASLNAVNVTTGRERQIFRLADLPAPAGTSPHPLSSLNIAIDATLGHVVMTLEREHVMNLWVASLKDGVPEGPVTQVTFEQEGAAFPHWSPDGRWISYQCTDGDSIQACVVGIDGVGRRQLTTGPGQNFLGGWMGNDTILVAARRRSVWNVIGLNRSDGSVSTLTPFTDARSYVRYPQWDAVGQRVFFERAEAAANIWTVDLRDHREAAR
ncbi:MAG TPA: winged helix-turn-helix domain-containing protein [Vicinamibacterales bacterium]|nr:winged helix-turn-helix domain-containing protein [Vicinamibacterales bacterium]